MTPTDLLKLIKRAGVIQWEGVRHAGYPHSREWFRVQVGHLIEKGYVEKINRLSYKYVVDRVSTKG